MVEVVVVVLGISVVVVVVVGGGSVVVEVVVAGVVVVVVVEEGVVGLLVVVVVIVVEDIEELVSEFLELTLLASALVWGGNVGKSILTRVLSASPPLPLAVLLASVVDLLSLSMELFEPTSSSSSSSSSSKSASILVRGVELRLPNTARNTSGPATLITWAIIRFTISSMVYANTTKEHFFCKRKEIWVFIKFIQIQFFFQKLLQMTVFSQMKWPICLIR